MNCIITQAQGAPCVVVSEPAGPRLVSCSQYGDSFAHAFETVEIARDIITRAEALERWKGWPIGGYSVLPIEAYKGG